jgi:glutamine synthetase
LASGLYGIQNKLTFQDIGQEKPQENAYENESLESFPQVLWGAVERMRKSSLPQELFGEVFVDHFIKSREWECQQFCQSVTDWEKKRYLEII